MKSFPGALLGKSRIGNRVGRLGNLFPIRPALGGHWVLAAGRLKNPESVPRPNITDQKVNHPELKHPRQERMFVLRLPKVPLLEDDASENRDLKNSL